MTGWRWALPVFIILACAECSKKGQVPRGILPRDKMEELVWDMAQAEQYAALYLARDSAKINLKTETLRLYAEVFRLHHVTREEFSKSYRYYLDHPELDQVLFDSVMARGARARTDMYERPYYHPPAPPVVRPGVRTVIPEKAPGRGKTATPVGGVVRGRPVPGVQLVPGNKLPAGRMVPEALHGLTPDEMRRARQAEMRRSQDSFARALRVRTDSMRKRH